MIDHPVIRIEDATVEHAVALAPHLRQADVDEVVVGGETPLGALTQSTTMSEVAYAVFFDDELACMVGVVPLVHGEGTIYRPWLLTGKAVDKHKRTFVCLSRWVMAHLLECYPELNQVVDARYSAALRWASAIGFDLGDSIPFGPEGMEHVRIRARRAEDG